MGIKNLKASFLIVNYKQTKEIFRLINLIEEQFNYDFEILVFNNSNNKIKTNSVNVFQYSVGKNIGYGKAINYLSIKARYDYLFILNPDIAIVGDLNESLRIFVNKHLKWAVLSLCAAEKLYTHPFFGKLLRSEKRFNGSAFIVYKEYFKILGGFDPNFFLYFEDCDFALKLKKFGLKTYFPKIEYVKHLKIYKNVTFTTRKIYYYESLLHYLKKNFKHYFYIYYFPINFVLLFLRFLRKK